MHCPKCHAENRDRDKFCVKCGTRLVPRCSQCGAELPSGAQFCGECGAPVAAPTPDAFTEAVRRLVPKEFADRLMATRGKVGMERRLVTILFSDVKGSTALAEKADPEDVMEIMKGAFDFLIPPIYRYEGTLARLMGDAVLALFGAPIAHEDDAERACRAALEILSGAKEYGAQLQRQRGLSGFSVRVGIHTGPVIVGEVGSDLRVEYTAMGDAINLASRMESAAEPGTVLITEDTHRLVAPLFETESLGRIEVKGRVEPVPAYRVLAARPGVGKVRGIRGLDSPLVGRDAEMHALQEAVDRLKAGVGGIATVVGEAGLGKSRLVAELRRGSDAATVSWVEGRCLSYGTSIAYLLWLDMLRRLLAVSEDAPPAEMATALHKRLAIVCPEQSGEVYPYLARLLSLPVDPAAEARLRDMDGRAMKAATFGAMETVLQCASKQQPLVVVCEDLHWADATSIELLEHLLPITDRAPLLLLCVMRPERDQACWKVRTQAMDQYPHRHTDVMLNPLSPADSDALVGNLLRVEGLPVKLKYKILQQAEGNPFYVEEVIRSLIDSGAITREEATGRWKATRDVADIAIPDTLQGVLQSRIDRLQEDTRRVLQMASVIGRQFLYKVLAEMAKEELGLDKHLVTLQREEMIRERTRVPEVEYAFKHFLTQEATYHGLLKKDRRVYHKKVAEALEKLFPERREELAGFLAYHWERAEDAAKAVEYLLKAGDAARLLYAHAEAVGFYERALALLKQQGDLERAARTLMKVGMTHHLAFEYQKSREAYDEGFDLSQVAAARASPAQVTAPHPLRLLAEEPSTLDPTMACDHAAWLTASQLFLGLAECGPELETVPRVARAWEVRDGGREYVFHLRDDLLWSDGSRLTAHDFEPSIQNMWLENPWGILAAEWVRPKNVRPLREGTVTDVRELGVCALDAETLRCEFERPAPSFLSLAGFFYARPRHTVEAKGWAWSEPGNIVTSGPFRLAEWRRGSSMTLVRNPACAIPGRGNVQRVELSFQYSADPSQRLAMYEADRLDALRLNGHSQEQMDRIRREYSSEYLSLPFFGLSNLGLPALGPPFDDLRVRRAFALAIDRDRLPDVAHGMVPPANGGVIPPGLPGHSPRIGLKFSPERARSLLAEAGFPNGSGFPLVRLLSVSEEEELNSFLRAQWRENLGVAVGLEIADSISSSMEMRQHAGQVVLSGSWWPLPDSGLYLRWVTAGDAVGWHDDAFDRLLDEEGQTVDVPTRLGLRRQADRIVIEQAAMVPLTYGRQHWLVKPWLKMPISPVGDFFWRDAIIEPH